MSDIPTGFKNAQQMTEEELKAKLMADYKVENTRKSNFPTEIINLPSRGLPYPEGHPLSSGTIEMKYMTAKEEDILTSPNLIKSGKVLPKLFQSLIVTPVQYGDILLCDMNAILIAARILAYGKDYAVEVEDPFSPDTKQKVVIDLTQIEDENIDYSKLTPGKNRFEFTLPHSKRIVEFKLLNNRDEEQIKEEIKSNSKGKLKSDISTERSTTLKYMITGVSDDNGSMITDRAGIIKFVDYELFALDARELRSYMKKMMPGTDLTFTFVSDITGEESQMDIPVGVNFFWPK
ncbi:hypothetical protein [Microcystis phage Mel-JY01]